MPKSPLKAGRNLCGLSCLCLALNACAAPPALQLLSLAIDGVSYLATDKTVADHGLSAIAQKDCKMLRTFRDEEICQEEEIIQEASID